ncbi:hypothetical protein [Longimicrobium sp.]|jgi:hypothetical protein|uniref:hypothetical protein n=1 Tax=Longimicrobium sp. TaxID=2029185 RepID=UPI002F95067A
MNSSFIGGVLLLYFGWMLVCGASQWAPLPEPWSGVLNMLWAAVLVVLQTVPWARFTRRCRAARPLQSTALHAFVAHVGVGAMAVILWDMIDKSFPARPEPSIGGMPIELLWVESDVPGYGLLSLYILTYAAASTVVAVVAGAVALRAWGRAGPQTARDLLRLGRTRRASV